MESKSEISSKSKVRLFRKTFYVFFFKVLRLVSAQKTCLRLVSAQKKRVLGYFCKMKFKMIIRRHGLFECKAEMLADKQRSVR